MEFSFTPIIGGALIGLSATILLAFNGKVAGISGILGGTLQGQAIQWRAPFLIGLFIAGILGLYASDSFGLAQPFNNTNERAMWVTALAGLLVGFGTRLGNGCTSGHGICGLSRASKRSLAATISFMITGAIAAFITQELIVTIVQK